MKPSPVIHLFTSWLVIPRNQFWTGVRLFSMIIVGALILSPVVGHLPILGWDWFCFFNRHDPDFNILSPTSAYPPYAPILLSTLTWMDWRISLSLLHSLTLLTVAVATWQNGGRYGSVLLALLTPPLWFLLWVGHPDGLALLGLITGFIPLALLKPQLTVFSLMSNKTLLAWTVVFLIVSLLIWPLWPGRLRLANLDHPAAFGWANTGWPILVLGLILLAGAGNHPYRLMAAGFLVTPYLMPYNLAVLAPAIGEAQGRRKVLLWASAWLTVLGVGLPGPAKYLSFIFPLSAYCLTHSLNDYLTNLAVLTGMFRRFAAMVFHKRGVA
jgi:hypothetical protein